MSLVALVSILALWLAAGLFASLFFFSAGFRFEPRRERIRARAARDASRTETA